LKNIFIFGEDPIGCSNGAQEFKSCFEKADFVAVQDYFITETAKFADLILPASFPAESGGSFTNTQKIFQKFDATLESKVELSNAMQLIELLKQFGITRIKDQIDAMLEAIAMLPQRGQKKKHIFQFTTEDNQNRIFEHGCDYIVKYFNEDFAQKFENNK
jgi:formate dehydrogenase major subunit